jgi:hypothetical protein
MSYRSNLVWMGAIILGGSLLGFYGQAARNAASQPSPKVSIAATGGLSGTWMTNDRGQITLQQSGNQVVWKCISSYDAGKTFTHTFRGTLVDNKIVGRFLDHPPGANRNSGNLEFEVDKPGHLKLTKSTGSFGAYSIDKISDAVDPSGTENLVDFSQDLIPAKEKRANY